MANALEELVGRSELSRALRGPEVMIACEDLAKRVVAHAKGIAPVFDDLPAHRQAPLYGEPGAYRDSITHDAPRVDGEHVMVRVYTNDYKAWWIEYGSRHMPEYAVFHQTAEAFGGTGPDMASEQVTTAHGILRAALEDLALARALPGHGYEQGMNKAAAIAKAKRSVEQARTARSAASKAASRGRGGRGRRRR